MFATKIAEISAQVEKIDPVEYARSRNFLNGAVTRLSPYISRGVISPKYVLDVVQKKGHPHYQLEKFIQELAWREYFQRVWQSEGNKIDSDLKHEQTDVENSQMPTALINAETGIEAVDEAVNQMYETGYIHNHLRMYIASIACNTAKSHWRVPAKWLYFHLRDADWASNALSWQWTAGAFSSKKYWVNQENINKYSGTEQRGTFLDADYSQLPERPIPEVLRETSVPVLKTDLPVKASLTIDNSLPTLVYNFYNLDPFWKSDVEANRVLLLEPTHFDKYPVVKETIDFALKLAENISGIQVYTGKFGELKKECGSSEIYYKEHPTAAHYQGIEEDRDWMFPEIKGYFPGFFGYWKKCERLLKARNKSR